MPVSSLDSSVKPLLIRRNNGEWLAISPKMAAFAIGVTAKSAEAAEEEFRSVYSRWISLYSEDT
jgi:hypothetical protein